MIDPTYAETYPAYMMADAEAEAEDARANAGYPKPIPAYMRAFWQTLHAQRAAERLAAVLALDHYYLLTGKGRVAAERVDAAARAQLDATRERTA